MGGIILGVAVAAVFIAGLYRVRTLAADEDLPVLCLALNESEYAESLLRASIGYMRRQALAHRLVVLVEGSWEAWRVAFKLSGKMAFEAVNLEQDGFLLENSRLRILDLRNSRKKGLRQLYQHLQEWNREKIKA